MKKCIGILGGMGPEATLLMFKKIIGNTATEKDQDHLEVIIHNNTRVPDRTQGILYGGESPLPEIVRSALLLQNTGADLIVMPCMTAHYFYDDVSRQIDIPFLNAINETVDHIKTLDQAIDNIGLLATTGTIKSRLFQTALSQQGINTILPPVDQQEALVMEAIYGKQGIKAQGKSTYTNSRLRQVGHNLIQNGAQAIITGCTEIAIAVGQADFKCPVIDPMDVLAHSAIKHVFQ